MKKNPRRTIGIGATVFCLLLLSVATVSAKKSSDKRYPYWIDGLED